MNVNTKMQLIQNKKKAAMAERGRLPKEGKDSSFEMFLNVLIWNEKLKPKVKHDRLLIQSKYVFNWHRLIVILEQKKMSTFVTIN